MARASSTRLALRSSPMDQPTPPPPGAAHSPRPAAAATGVPVDCQRAPALCVHSPNLLHQPPVGLLMATGRSLAPGIVAAWRHPKCSTQPPHRILLAMPGDEVIGHSPLCEKIDP